PIIPQSRLWVFLSQRYENRRMIEQSRKEAIEWGTATGQPIPTKNLPHELFDRVERGELAFFKRTTSARVFRGNIDYIFQAITEMNDLLKTRGTKFMVAFYPDVIQVNPQEFETVTKKFSLDGDDYDVN